MINIFNADAVTWAKEYAVKIHRGESLPFHSLLCDPPYHLHSPNGISNHGFMGKLWDGGNVAFDPETWFAFKDIMYDGAFGMAFASARGWHRMAVSIEDAGFVIHPTMFGWAYGSGFPKSTRILSREYKETNQPNPNARPNSDNRGSGVYGYGNGTSHSQVVTQPATDHAKIWEGHRYGLQSLKPALEPIIVFQKPYRGKPVENIVETGAGALWIDGGRIETNEDTHRVIKVPRFNGSHFANGKTYGSRNENDIWEGSGSPLGRWASNLILLDDKAARALDEQSGERIGSNPIARPAGFRRFNGRDYANGQEYHSENGYVSTDYDDIGGASKFFFRIQEQIDESDPIFYCPKSSRRERDSGLDEMPDQKRRGEWATIQDGRPHMENGYVYEGKPIKNPHPTVKPIALAKYLATLLLPPAEYTPRRLFVPFAGVASECIGASKAGWDEIVGVELTEEYIPIAEARITYWENKEIKPKQTKPTESKRKSIKNNSNNNPKDKTNSNGHHTPPMQPLFSFESI